MSDRDQFLPNALFSLLAMVRRSKERFEVRLSHATLSKIDEKIGEERCMKNVRDVLLDLIRNDPEIRDEFSKI